MSIQIIASKGNTRTVVDSASNKKDAKVQIDYWQRLKGKGWKVKSEVFK